MKRTLIAGACALALLVGMAPNAQAATPEIGSYWGYSEFGGHVVTGKIETADRWKTILVKTCDRQYRFVNKRIHKDGRFVGTRRDQAGNVVFTLSAKFDDPDIAWGFIQNDACGGFTAVYLELVD